MNPIISTHIIIANILSFEHPRSALANQLRDPHFNWDAIVVEGSKQLVLPAIYCRLKAKNLLNILPTDLVNYLEEITSINRQRNLSILAQVQAISKILKQHHINHVFLKGTALLALGCYEDNAERMVGDIDILVEKDQVQNAFELLKDSGYPKTHGFNYETKNFRHLDRLISDHELAAVEIHSELFKKKHWSIIDVESVLQTKMVTDNIPLPNLKYLSLHLILSWQLNDHGHYYNTCSLKSIYDILAIKMHKDRRLLDNLLNLKYVQSYFELAKHYFIDVSEISSNRYMRYRGKCHLLTSRNRSLQTGLTYLKSTLKFIGNRLHLLFTNTSYLKHIIAHKILKR
ncbi:nucleotidyltransferase family protein [Winogradskyella arenosi]|uniref:Putative nucleotidyltransferase-like protein n=1 Tax=Winogradskyella arenosi TaxID=533325 RepID=A0A368ZBN5_9FLAO|nr:nucleotidyltransferase family protein [Winogradskyella arenosi]RCW90273.1 putative nucleotidyltransferase-like protein [Winogradskyella arenosi]